VANDRAEIGSDLGSDFNLGHCGHVVENASENDSDFTMSLRSDLSGHFVNNINSLGVARVGAHFPTESAFGVALWRSPRLFGA